MMQTRILEIKEHYRRVIIQLGKVQKNPLLVMQMVKSCIAEYGSERAAVQGLMDEARTCRMVSDRIDGAKTIMFDTNQIDYFLNSDFPEGAIYQLPFESCFIQFTRSIPVEVPVSGGIERHGVVGIWMYQKEITQQEEEESKSQVDLEDRYSKGAQIIFGIEPAKSVVAGEVLNRVIVFYEDLDNFRMAWKGRRAEVSESEKFSEFENLFKKISVLCSVYINCKNMELVEFPENKSAAKKARKKYGVNPPPYYRCLIKGKSQSDFKSGDSPGFKHGHRYDVRGHFRTLGNGGVTWVVPHMRGLDNELYIPKTYVAR